MNKQLFNSSASVCGKVKGEKMETLIKTTLTVLVFFALIAIFGFVITLPVYYLWNWLMPELFALKAITFWQAYGLVWLSSCLFRLFRSAPNTK